ncbi:hypothetical protein BD309DRAFT_972073 [Dichomitus squalens]|nr:hypothetical protein BD309DRAFT_972073 [Dichomitus squalens]
MKCKASNQLTAFSSPPCRVVLTYSIPFTILVPWLPSATVVSVPNLCLGYQKPASPPRHR